MKELSPLAQRTITLVRSIPKGKVLSYGEVAKLISAPGCARHVSYILSSSSAKYDLPWHRVVNGQGKISLPLDGYFRQKELLEKEKVIFKNNKVDFKIFLWKPSKKELQKILKNLPKHKPIN